MKNIHLIPTDKPSRLWTNNLRRRLELDEFIEQHPTNIAKHIYITSDEDINENDYIITQDGRLVQVSYLLSKDLEGASKVILTTDTDLIKDTVQAIDDKFLEWFVKNPSCKEVEVLKIMSIRKYKMIIPQEEPKQFIDCKCTNALEAENCTRNCGHGEEPKQLNSEDFGLPKFGTKEFNTLAMEMFGGKPKQETLEEASLKMGLMEIELNHTKTLLASCEKALEERDLQAERMYSEEEVQVKLYECLGHFAQKYNIIINGNEIDEWFNQFKKK
jgi:hypothetical protein